MPHKRNPAISVRALACAAKARRDAGALIAAEPHEHERAAGAWHAEWDALTGALEATGGAVAAVAEALAGLEVDTARMRQNLDMTGGLIMAERVAFAAAEQHRPGRRAATGVGAAGSGGRGHELPAGAGRERRPGAFAGRDRRRARSRHRARVGRGAGGPGAGGGGLIQPCRISNWLAGLRISPIGSPWRPIPERWRWPSNGSPTARLCQRSTGRRSALSVRRFTNPARTTSFSARRAAAQPPRRPPDGVGLSIRSTAPRATSPGGRTGSRISRSRSTDSSRCP